MDYIAYAKASQKRRSVKKRNHFKGLNLFVRIPHFRALCVLSLVIEDVADASGIVDLMMRKNFELQAEYHSELFFSNLS